jgi:lantibiotic modifying enzyme
MPISMIAVDWELYERQPKDTKVFLESSECKEILAKGRELIKENVTLLQSVWPPDQAIVPSSNPKSKSKDNSVYIGAGGNAYLNWKLHRFFKREGDEEKSYEHLLRALESVNTALLLIHRDHKGKGCSFYMGSPGIYTLATILYNIYEEPASTEKYLNKLLGFLPDSLLSDTPDELLYGRAGYLSCLLMVKRHIPDELCKKVNLEDAMYKVFNALISSGQTPHSSKKVLRYTFYGTDYIGAAHGVAGILYVLLQFPEWCKEPTIQPWIIETLNNLISTQTPAGNFPTVESGRREALLVHWCHGSPGIAPVLYRAYKIFKDVQYLQSMEKALSCVWKCGLLKKGFGLCHGITGNAYTFLCFYRFTGQMEYYYKAVQMAKSYWNEDLKLIIGSYVDPQRFKVGVPDTPYSLMEGAAGIVCFYCDLLYPDEASFPGYDGEFD